MKLVVCFVACLAFTEAAVPFGMRGPGDKPCTHGDDGGCDGATTFCMHIKFYPLPWEYDHVNAEEEHQKGTVCMCKKGYEPLPGNEMACQPSADVEEGELSPPACPSFNSCDAVSTHCVPDLDNFLGYRCDCNEGFLPDPEATHGGVNEVTHAISLKCTWAPYMEIKSDSEGGSYYSTTAAAVEESTGAGSGSGSFDAWAVESEMATEENTSEESAMDKKRLASFTGVTVGIIAAGFAMQAMVIVSRMLKNRRQHAANSEPADVTLTPSNL